MKNSNYLEKITKLKTLANPTLNDTIDIIVPLHLYYKKMTLKVKELLETNYDLTQSELNLLVALSTTKDESGTLAPTALYEDLLFSSGGMTKLLKKLEQKGCITRVENPDDKRSKLVKITQSGIDTATLAINDVLNLETKYLSNLSNKEKESLLNIFQKLISQE